MRIAALTNAWIYYKEWAMRRQAWFLDFYDTVKRVKITPQLSAEPNEIRNSVDEPTGDVGATHKVPGRG